VDLLKYNDAVQKYRQVSEDWPGAFELSGHPLFRRLISRVRSILLRFRRIHSLHDELERRVKPADSVGGSQLDHKNIHRPIALPTQPISDKIDVIEC
jgi:hypothetical protein